MGDSVLVLFAVQLTRAMGPPSDVVAVASDTPEGLLRLMDRAFEQWGPREGDVPAQCEVVEVWRLTADAPTWEQQVDRVARLSGGYRWLDAWGEPIEVEGPVR